MRRLDGSSKLVALVFCFLAIAVLPLAAGRGVQVRIVSPDIGERTIEIEKGGMFMVPTRLREGFLLEGITDQLGDFYSPGQNIVVNYDLTLTYKWKLEPSPERDFNWRSSKEGITITGYKGTRKTVVIPGSIDGKPVTKIGDSAFVGCEGIASAVIPSGVAEIGLGAFFGCSGLESIEIPDSVRSIGHGAFGACAALASADIPHSVTSIGDWAFTGCSSLTSISIPASVERIGANPFAGCSGLASIHVDPGNPFCFSSGNCLVSKSGHLISGCRNSVIPRGVEAIGAWAFYGCTGLKSVTIPESVDWIGANPFAGCSGLASIQVDPDNPSYFSSGGCLVSKSDGVLVSGCRNSVIPGGGRVATIGSAAFLGCSGLARLSIPDSVESILDRAFCGCTGLSSLTIPSSVTSIGLRAFAGWKENQTITVADGTVVSDWDSDCGEGCEAKIVFEGKGLTIYGNSADLSSEEIARLVDPPEPEPVRKEPVVFRIANGVEPESLDPHLTQGAPEQRILMALFDGLVIYDPKTAGPVPGVAESWDISEDGTVYTFHLRDCEWSDGVPITADDVVYSWLRELDPKTASPYAWFPAMFLKGGAEYNAGKAGASAVGIRALDENTFQMELVGPLPYALGALSHHSFAIVPKHTIEKHGKKWILPENFVGNGAFTLAEWKPRQFVEVVRNPNYWDKDNVHLDAVVFYSSDDHNKMYKMFLNHEIDWDTSLPDDEFRSAMRRREFIGAPQLSTYYYIFQTETPPLDDPNVRKALARAVDCGQLEGALEPCWGLVPDMAGYEALAFPDDHSVEAARRYLADAGYPNGAGFPRISILYNTGGGRNVAQFVQREWKRNLGIESKLVEKDWTAYLDRRNAGDFQVARVAWIGDYQDPTTFLDMFVTGGELNEGRYSNPKYDALIRKSATMPDGPDRMAVLREAENILVNDDQAVMPLYFYESLNLIDTDVWGGFHSNAMDCHPVKNIYKK